jgi:hypothetical protein
MKYVEPGKMNAKGNTRVTEIINSACQRRALKYNKKDGNTSLRSLRGAIQNEFQVRAVRNFRYGQEDPEGGS